MEFGFSGKAFGNLMVLDAIIGVIVIFLVFWIARRRGIDITTRRFGIEVALSSAFILGIIPFWLSDLTVQWKIIGTILGLSVGIGNYFATDTMQRILRGLIGDKRKKGE